MRYYGIVNHLHQPGGWYGRIPPKREALKKVQTSVGTAAWGATASAALWVAFPVPFAAARVAANLVTRAARALRVTPLRRFGPDEQPSDDGVEIVIVSNDVLDKDYRVRDEDRRVLHGLIDTRKRFREMMRSGGGCEWCLRTSRRARRENVSIREDSPRSACPGSVRVPLSSSGGVAPPRNSAIPFGREGSVPQQLARGALTPVP